MHVTAADEFPFHQHPTPFNIPSTSDIHFNDGYFCAAFAEDLKSAFTRILTVMRLI